MTTCHAEGLDLLRPYRVLVTGKPSGIRVITDDGCARRLDCVRVGRLMYLGGKRVSIGASLINPMRPGHDRGPPQARMATRAPGTPRSANTITASPASTAACGAATIERPQALAGVGIHQPGFRPLIVLSADRGLVRSARCVHLRGACPRSCWGDFGILAGWRLPGLEIDCVDPMLGDAAARAGGGAIGETTPTPMSW